MIHDKSFSLGCAAVQWTVEDGTGTRKNTRITCDYGKANYAYRPVYEFLPDGAEFCSGCPSGCDQGEFFGLCEPTL
jgi:hypothetical protein